MPVDGMAPVASRGVPSSENTPGIIMEKETLHYLLCTGKSKGALGASILCTNAYFAHIGCLNFVTNAYFAHIPKAQSRIENECWYCLIHSSVNYYRTVGK